MIEQVQETMMRMWRLVTYGMSRDSLIEVSVEQAVENYLAVFHSPDKQVCRNSYPARRN